MCFDLEMNHGDDLCEFEKSNHHGSDSSESCVNSDQQSESSKVSQSHSVLVHVKGSHRDEDGEEMSVNFQCGGKLIDKGEHKILVYKELAESGLGSTLTQLHLMPDQSIRLVRTGDLKFSMHLSDGAREMTKINTPYGLMTLGILVHKAHFKCKSNGGRVDISYVIDYGDQTMVDTKLDIKYSYETN